MSKLREQAEQIASKLGVELEVSYREHGKHFDNDTVCRDIYDIKLKRGNQVYQFKFGQSVSDSRCQLPAYLKNDAEKIAYLREYGILSRHKAISNYDLPRTISKLRDKKRKDPDMYDVLACLTKHNPGSFEEFCSNYGYDDDSMKAHKIYQAVVSEYLKLSAMFSEQELETLQEIS